MSTAYKQLNESQQAQLKAYKDQARASLNLKSAQKEEALETAKLAIKKQELAKATKQAALEELGLVSEYQKVVQRMNQAGKVVQNLTAKRAAGNALSNKEQAELKQSTREFKKYQTAVLQADKSIGRFQRNVGDYPKGLQAAAGAARNLASALGLVGGAFLFVQTMRNAIKVMRDFEKQNATLTAILQVEKSETKELREEAVRLGSTTVKTAGQVTSLQIAYARLGFSQKEIIDLTESTISGSIAMNSELDKTAELVGAVVNTFDDLGTTDAPKIIDILSLSTAKSALNFSKLETGLPIVAGAANAAGVSFTKLVSLMGKLSDSGIDISSSSTALRNIFIESAAQGLNYAEIIQKIKDSQDKLTASNDEFGKRAAVSATVLAQNIDSVDELDEALQNAAGTAESMANKELNTLDGSLQLLQSAWEGYILKIDESSEASINIKTIIAGLAKNLETIIDTIVMVVKGWVAYKVAVLTARLQTSLMNKQLALSRLNAIKSAKGIKVATVSWRAFNQVLKANALFLAITAIVGLIAVFKKLNKSIIETSNELNEANNEFLEQADATIKLNVELSKSADRYDELTKKSKLNKTEQKELDKIIRDIAKHVPEAVTEVDIYGNALSINTEKVKEFNKENGNIAKLQAEVNIEKQKKALDRLEKTMSKVIKTSKGESFLNVPELGKISKATGELSLAIENHRTGSLSFTKLTKEQQLVYEKYVKSLEKGIDQTKDGINANEDVIASITGELNERQKLEKAQEEANKKTEEDTKLKEEQAIITKQLRQEIALLESQLSDLTKGGRDNLTLTDSDIVLSIEKQIEAKKKELNERLGIHSKIRKSGKKTVNYLQELAEFELEQKIKYLDAFIDYEENSNYQRIRAVNERTKVEMELEKMKTSFVINENNLKGDALVLAERQLQAKLIDIVRDSNKEINKISQRDETDNSLDEEDFIGFDTKDYLIGALVEAGQGTFDELQRLYDEDREAFLKLAQDKLNITQRYTQAQQDAINNAFGAFGEMYGIDATKFTKLFEGKKLETQEYVEIAAEAVTGLYNSFQHNYQEDLDRLQATYEQSLQFAGEGTAARAELEKQYAEQQKKIRQRQAKQEKDQAIFRILINTATGVTAALTSTPPNVPLSVAIGILGALQLAKVASIKVPQFKDGVRGFDGGLAILGDGGKSEIVRTPDGKISKTPATDTLYNLPKGTDIFKDEDSFMKDLKEMTNMHNIMFHPYLTNEVPQLPNIEISNGIDENQLDRVIGKHFSNIKTQNTIIDKKGIQTFINNGYGKTVQLNNRVTFKGISV